MKRTTFISLVLIFCLLATLVAVPVNGATVGDDSKLISPELSLIGTTSINSDITVGYLPKGVSIGGVDIHSPDSTKFSFTSDDGSRNDWIFRDVFVGRGVSCTIPVVENYVTGRSTTVQVSLDNLITLQNDFGYEIGSHSYDHIHLPKCGSIEEVKFQLEESKRALSVLGLNIKNFYVPFGDYTEDILDESAKIYRATRTSKMGNNMPLDKRNLKTIWLDSGITLEYVKQEVDKARENDNYIIFGFHATTASRKFMGENVGALIDYIHSFDDTQVLTVDKALDRIENVVGEGVDYRVDYDELILDKFFLRSLPIGENTLTFNFSDGTSETLKITIQKNEGIRQSITVTESSLIDGENKIGAGQTITFKADLDTNLSGDFSSTATIGSVTVAGALKDNVYTYVFNTDKIENGNYDKLIIESKVGTSSVIYEHSIQLVIEKIPTVKTVKHIEITVLPSRTEYLIGEEFSDLGMVVKAYYDDGTNEVVTDYLVSGYTSTPGTKTVTVSYENAHKQFDVTVVDKQISSIAITKNPEKLVYYQGQELDLSGMVVEAYFNDDTSIQITGYIAAGDTSKIGSVEIIINYEEYSDKFIIDVSEKIIESIEVTALPKKLAYYKCEPLDLSGMIVTAIDTEGIAEKIENYTISGYDSNKTGKQMVLIFFAGLTDSFEVTVLDINLTGIEINSNPTKVKYLEGDEFELQGLVVVGYYEDNTDAAITGYSLTGYSPTPGIKTITVSYGGFETEFNVSVIRKQIVSIEITKDPYIKKYYYGVEELDAKGMVVTASYNNGAREAVTAYYLENYVAKIGENEITVNYSGFTDTFVIKIIESNKCLDFRSLLCRYIKECIVPIANRLLNFNIK